MIDDVAGGARHPVVDLGLQLDFVGQAAAEVGERPIDALAQFAVRVVERPDGVALQLTPQRAEPGPDVGVGEQLGLQLLALGQQLWIAAQPIRERDDACIDRVPHLVVRIRGDLGEEAVRAAVDLGEQLVVDRLGNPPRRLVLEPFPERRPVVVEEALQAVQHRVEQPLVMPTFDGQIDRLADERRHRRGPDPTLDQRLQRRRDIAIVEHFQRRRAADR